MKKFYNRFNGFFDEYQRFGLFNVIRDSDAFLAKYVFEIKDFDSNAWYYNKAAVRKFKAEVLHINSAKAWYEEDHYTIITKGFVFLLNYPTFMYLAVVLYAFLLLGAIFVAYNLYWVSIIYCFV